MSYQSKNEDFQTLYPDIENSIIPVMPLRGVVSFPNLIMHFEVARSASLNAVEYAVAEHRQTATNHRILLLTQKNALTKEPTPDDLYQIGTVCVIRQVLRTNDGCVRVLVEGLHRAKVTKLVKEKDIWLASFIPLNSYSPCHVSAPKLDAVIRTVKDTFTEYSNFVPKMSDELLRQIVAEFSPEKLFESIVFNTPIEYPQKQRLLEAGSISQKLKMLLDILASELEVLKLENDIQEKVKENIDKSQKEYYLREQLHVISQQLGQEDNPQDELYDYMMRIMDAKLPDKSAEKLIDDAEKLSRMPVGSQEAYVLRSYLDTCLQLPWNKLSKAAISLPKSAKVLDKEHYGMEKVKQRILESIAVSALVPNQTGQILCLVGPPGVGKTSIGKSVAKALGRKYVRVSLGGIKDEAEIRGHRKTYIGAMPGRIINAMKQAGTSNPLILFDEIDKMSNDFHGDPASAMLEVLDSEQNVEFRDHYIELPFDLSRVMFITTANTTDTIPQPLLDRMEVIELPSYTTEEKYHITHEHLISKQIKKHGLKGTQLKISDQAIYAIIESYTREAGVRTLERCIGTICRKAAKEIVEGTTKRVNITTENLDKYLGTRKYTDDEHMRSDSVGVVNGLAWTSVGGVLMPLEAVIVPLGKGDLQITGSLGNVMQESAKLAFTICKLLANEYGYSADFAKTNDIHIHAPEGAVPKDGPSAGVTLVTALVSALSGIPVRSDVAMTGEITLHGKVLPIGGLREKTMAAYRNGIKTVIAPIGNKPDFDDLDETVKSSIEFVFASDIHEVLRTALISSEKLDRQKLMSSVIPAISTSEAPMRI